MGWVKWRALGEVLEPASQPLHKTRSHSSAPPPPSPQCSPLRQARKARLCSPPFPWGFSGSFIHSCVKRLQIDVPKTKTPLPKVHPCLPITSRIETQLVLLTSPPGLKSFHELILSASSLNTTPQLYRTIFVCLDTSHYCTPLCLCSSWSFCPEHSLPPPEPDELLQASELMSPPPGSLP